MNTSMFAVYTTTEDYYDQPRFQGVFETEEAAERYVKEIESGHESAFSEALNFDEARRGFVVPRQETNT